MNLSTVFVLIAAAFTGSANAAEINNGNLRANALQKNTEVFEDISLLDDEAKIAFDNCAATCAVFKKPKDKDVVKIGNDDIESDIAACVDGCYNSASNSDAAVKSALEKTINPACAMKCTESAAKKFEEVSNKCDSKKDYNCEKCDDVCAADDDSCKNKLEKCEKALKACEKCVDEIKKAKSSVKKVAKALPTCLANDCVFPDPSETAIEIA